MHLVSPERPDRPRGPPDHLFSSYRRLFLWAKTARAWSWLLWPV